MRNSTFFLMSCCVQFCPYCHGCRCCCGCCCLDIPLFLPFLGVPFGSGLSFTKRSGQTRTNGHQGRTKAAEVEGWRVGAASAKHAPSFGTQTALARTDSERPVQRGFMRWAATGAARSGRKTREAPPRSSGSFVATLVEWMRFLHEICCPVGLLYF